MMQDTELIATAILLQKLINTWSDFIILNRSVIIVLIINPSVIKSVYAVYETLFDKLIKTSLTEILYIC